MRIEITHKNGDVIDHFESACNPFKIGEVIHVTVTNECKEDWTVEDLTGDFKVENIEHYYRKTYGYGGKCYMTLCVVVQVTSMDKQD